MGQTLSGGIFAGPPGQYDGVASGAKIAFMDLANEPMCLAGSLALPSTAKQLYDPGFVNAGARAHSNSWSPSHTSFHIHPLTTTLSPHSPLPHPLSSPRGTGFVNDGGQANGSYSTDNADTDNYLWTHQETALIIFAGGNWYDIGGTPNPLAKYTVSTQSSAKNILSIGASYTSTSVVGINDITRTIFTVATYSGRGPLYDNRFAPLLIGPGDRIESAASSGYPPVQQHPTCVMREGTGTSLSAPAVAGAALMIRQFFGDIAFWPTPFKPSGDRQ